MNLRGDMQAGRICMHCVEWAAVASEVTRKVTAGLIRPEQGLITSRQLYYYCVAGSLCQGPLLIPIRYYS